MLALVDNVEKKLFAPSLAAALTTDKWQDRILGKNEMIYLSNPAVWVFNGNNITLGGDLPRRFVWARMDAETSRPWQRERQFKYPDVMKHVRDHRGHILAAILTITRYWVQQGKPVPGNDVPKLGGFQQWRDTIGGILATAGFTGFLANLDQLYEELDVDGTQWDVFIAGWYEIWGERPITTADLIAHVKAENDSTNPLTAYSLQISEVLPDGIADAINDRKGSLSRRVGNAIRKHKDRVFTGGLRLVKDGVSHQAATWCVKKVILKSGDKTPQTPPVQETQENCAKCDDEVGVSKNGFSREGSTGESASKRCSDEMVHVHAHARTHTYKDLRTTPTDSPSDVKPKIANSHIPKTPDHHISQTLIVRITADIDPFVGIDGREYETMPGDTITLPQENALALIEKKAAVLVGKFVG